MKKIFTCFIISILFLSLFFSCKSKKDLSISPETVVYSNETVAHILEMQPHFITANASKLEINFSLKDKELKSDGACRIYRDSVIQLSIQPFMGIELLRIELTPEAMYLFDKMNNKYYHLIYEQLAEYTGIPLIYSDFQSLLSNQLFCLGSEDTSNFEKMEILKSGNIQISVYQTGKYVQKTFFDGKNIIKVEVKNEDFLFTADYSDFRRNNGIDAPATLKINFLNKKNSISLAFNIKKVEFNKEMRATLTNPLRYQKGNLENLLDNLPF